MTSFPVISGLAPPIKNPGYACGYNGYLPPVTVTSDVRLIRPGTRIDDWGGGGRNKFWGAREVYLCEFERETQAREIYPSLDQMNKVKIKKKKVFTEIQRDFLVEIRNSTGFSGRKQVISKKKRPSLKFRGIFWPESEIQTVFPAKNR